MRTAGKGRRCPNDGNHNLPARVRARQTV